MKSNVDEVMNKLDVIPKKSGELKVVNSVNNYMEILRNDNRFKDIIVFNEHTQRIEVKKMYKNDKLHSLCDNDYNHIFNDIEKDYKISGNNNLKMAIPLIAEENSYNPVIKYFDSLKWDGIDRITTMFHDTLGAEKNEYNANVARLMLLGAIARNYNHGCKFDYCIILSSENTQGLGKSSLCRKLAVNEDWFTDSLTSLDGNKDTLQMLRGKVIIELGELKSMNRSRGGVEAVKQFLTAQSDTYRDPFDKYTSDFKRSCIFVGTTNRGEYLIDDTGNRRFLPVICASNDQPETLKRIKYHMYENTKEIKDYVDQLYAQAVHIYKNGEYSLVLDMKNELELEKLHKRARIYNPMVDEIQNYINAQENGYQFGVLEIYNDVYLNGGVDGFTDKTLITKQMPKDIKNEIKSILTGNDLEGIVKVDGVRAYTRYSRVRLSFIVRKNKKEEFKPLPKELETEFKQVGFLK